MVRSYNAGGKKMDGKKIREAEAESKLELRCKLLFPPSRGNLKL